MTARQAAYWEARCSYCEAPLRRDGGCCMWYGEPHDLPYRDRPDTLGLVTTAGSPPYEAFTELDPPDEGNGEVASPARAQVRSAPSDGPPPLGAAQVPTGVDLYENNAWFADATVAFMVLKAWEYRADARFAARWPLVKAQGRFRGAYLFGHPSLNAASQAASFARVLRDCGFGPGDRAWLDHEVTDGRSPAYCASWAQECCGQIDADLGLPHGGTGVYTYTDFIRQGNCAGLGNRPLWFARPVPLGPWQGGVNLGPWSRPALVQYKVTSIDWDYFNGTPAELKAFWGAAAPQPKPQPKPPPAPAPTPANWTEQLMSELPTVDTGTGGFSEDMQSVQGLLCARGFTVKMDGIPGPVSRAAMQAFQHSRGLTADGQCGPRSWPKLLNRLAR